MAKANDYKVLFSSYQIVTPTLNKAGGHDQFHLPRTENIFPISEELREALDWTRIAAFGVVYAMQKRSEADFCYPYQGGSLPEVQRKHGYSLQFLQSPPSHACIPLVPDSIHGKDLLNEVRHRVITKFKNCLSLKFK
jgi:hypothetical protein